MNSWRIVKSQSLSRHKDEKNDQCRVNQYRDHENHKCTFVEEFADIRFPDSREWHEGIFTKAEESEDGVECILMGAESVDSNGEGKDELELC